MITENQGKGGKAKWPSNDYSEGKALLARAGVASRVIIISPRRLTPKHEAASILARALGGEEDTQLPKAVVSCAQKAWRNPSAAAPKIGDPPRPAPRPHRVGRHAAGNEAGSGTLIGGRSDRVIQVLGGGGMGAPPNAVSVVAEAG